MRPLLITVTDPLSWPLSATQTRVRVSQATQPKVCLHQMLFLPQTCLFPGLETGSGYPGLHTLNLSWMMPRYDHYHYIYNSNHIVIPVTTATGRLSSRAKRSLSSQATHSDTDSQSSPSSASASWHAQTDSVSMESVSMATSNGRAVERSLSEVWNLIGDDDTIADWILRWWEQLISSEHHQQCFSNWYCRITQIIIHHLPVHMLIVSHASF